MFASTLTMRQHLGRKQHFLDQVAAGDERAGRLGQRGRKPGPRQDAAEHEQRVRLDAFDVVFGSTVVKTNE